MIGYHFADLGHVQSPGVVNSPITHITPVIKLWIACPMFVLAVVLPIVRLADSEASSEALNGSGIQSFYMGH